MTALEVRVTGVEALMRPRAVALIGVSDDPMKMSGNPIRALRNGAYQGAVYPVNATRDEVGGMRSYKSVEDIDGPVDVAVITLPREQVVAAVEQCGRKGVKAVVIISAGFAEIGGDGVAMQRDLAAMAAKYSVSVVGPNCTGYYSGAADLPCGTSASFVTGRFRKGSTGMITQSGALGTSLLAQGKERGIGARYWVSTGNEMDLSVADFLRAGAADDGTRAICVYLEAIRDVTTATAGAGAALEAGKPIIVLKVGTSAVGAERAMAHTGALIGSDSVYSGFFRQHGVLRIDSIDHLLPVASLFASRRRWAGRRVGVLSISGAYAAHMADRLAAVGVELAPFEPATIETLQRLSRNESAGNPYDPTGLAITHPDFARQALHAIANDATVDVVVVAVTFSLHMLRIMTPIVAEVARLTDKMLCMIRWLPADYHPEYFEPFDALDVPLFLSLEECAVALSCRDRYERERPLLLEAAAERRQARPALAAPELDAAGALLETEGRALFRRYGIAGPAERVAADAEGAVAAAREIGFPVVMKILSRDVLHKTEIGGVAVGLRDEVAVREAHARLTGNFARHCPGGTLGGILVQAMAGDGIEAIVGARHEPPFGPVVMLGIGGVLAEAIGRAVVRPVPLSRFDAEQMIDECGLAPLLASARTGRGSDRAALCEALLSMSRLMTDHGARIAEAEINPLRVLAEGEGTVALDALVVPGSG